QDPEAHRLVKSRSGPPRLALVPRQRRRGMPSQSTWQPDERLVSATDMRMNRETGADERLFPFRRGTLRPNDTTSPAMSAGPPNRWFLSSIGKNHRDRTTYA